MFEVANKKNEKYKKNIFFISGGTDVENRENIRNIVEKEKDAIIFASVQTMGTGVNIVNLHNIIFTFSTKSVIRVLQSIGRVLRVSDEKTEANLYDIIDNISWKSKKNYGMKHALKRIEYYTEERFPYKLKEINFNP